MRRLSCLVVLFLISCCVCCHGQGVAQENAVKPDPAKLTKSQQSIHLWASSMGVSNLTFKKILPTDSVRRFTRYVLETDDGQEFQVNPDSGEVVGWCDMRYKPNDGSEPGAKRIPDSEVDSIAEAFVRQHYPSYQSDKLQQRTHRIFFRRLDNGVIDPGVCIDVSVDFFTGKVFRYEILNHQNPYISTNPKISNKEAENIALNVLTGMPELEKEGYDGAASAFIDGDIRSSICYDNIGLQCLVYGMTVVTSDNPNYTRHDYEKEKAAKGHITGRLRTVLVDALTGELICVDGFVLEGVIPGLRKKAETLDSQQQKYLTDHVVMYDRMGLGYGNKIIDTFAPPLLINGQPYFYVRMIATLLGRKVLTEDDHSIVVSGDSYIEFRADSKEAKIGGKTVDFGKPAKGIFGRTYIPLLAIKQIFGMSPIWDKSDKSYNIISIPEVKQ